MHSIWIDPQGIWVTAHPQGPGVISGSRPWFGYGNSRIEDEVCGPWWLGIVTGGVRIPNPILDAAVAHLRHSRITRFTWNDPGNPIVSRETSVLPSQWSDALGGWCCCHEICKVRVLPVPRTSDQGWVREWNTNPLTSLGKK